MKLYRAGLLFLSVMTVSFAGCCGGQMGNCSKEVRFQPAETDSINVMTFNIRTAAVTDLWNHWVFRRQSVFDSMASHAADIIGVQEAKDSQVRDIQKALPQYSNYAVGRVNGKHGGETNAIFYRKDRFSLLDSGTFWFSDTPSKPGSRDWGNIYPRICSWVHLAENKSGARFYVYNTHLDVFSQNSRARSAELLARNISARKVPDPFIIMGDLNMKVDNPAMAYMDGLGYKSADPEEGTVAGKQNVGTRRAFLGLGKSPRIDHIRISSGLQGIELSVDRRQVNGRRPSDHYPVIARIRIDDAS